MSSLSKKYPTLKVEFADDLNSSVSLDDFSEGSDKKVWWRCSKDERHVWEAQIRHRINGSNCPKCSNQTSQLEIRVYCETKALFDNTSWRQKVEGIEADVLVGSLKLIIEIDGAYWHNAKVKADKDKTLFFSQKVIR